MTELDLLAKVQPDAGYFAIVGIDRNGDVKQRLVDTREDAESVIQNFVGQERNVYFGVAKFATEANRTKQNVLGLKAFWLDIDCGPTKAEVNSKTGKPGGYATQQEALDALQDFCTDIGLPVPIVVDSGRGLHVYWPLTEHVERVQWEPVAKHFRDLCLRRDLYVDPVVFEAARILRVPGTYNYKDDPPSLVEVVHDCEPIAFEEFAKLVGATTEVLASRKTELTPLQKQLNEAREASFRKIVHRSLSGEGCEQIKHAVLEADSTSEPLWFSALSIAHHCSDRDTAIHKLSSGHPEYDPIKTEEKTQHIKGPHNCSTFEEANPGGCDKCKWKGKIKNPISLGSEIVEATDTENVVNALDSHTGEVNSYVIPKYPFPFFRGKNGGIYMRAQSEESDDILVYEYDLYCVRHMKDPIFGNMLLMRLHLPQEGVEEFTIPFLKVTDRSELRRELSKNGVACTDKKFPLLAECILYSFRDIQFQNKADKMRMQFGWTDEDSKFILGTKEISINGVYNSPASSVTAKIADRITVCGDYEKWKEVFSLYNTPGLEPHAFATLTAFGAPLFKFFGHKGLIINVIHSHSGTGKTTILHMCNSVYGSPDGLCAIQDDTLNAKIMRLGVMRNLPFTVDEITNMDPKDFSVLSYAMTQGRGKDRVSASVNELRNNNTTWETISLCSANASFYEKLEYGKRAPDGERMRLLEYRIEYSDALDPAVAKNMFDQQLFRNYGHAGEIYITWLVHNLEEAKSICMRTQEIIDRDFGLTQKERFWSAGIAANLAGGFIAKKLGIIDWDLTRIREWVRNMIVETRGATALSSDDALHVLGDFINRHINHTLVINDEADARSGMNALPVVEPKGPLLIRFEPDTRKLFVASKEFRQDCIRQQINYRDLLKSLTDRGIMLKKTVKRMSKGMSINSPSVEVLVVDSHRAEFDSIENLSKGVESAEGAEAANAEGGGS